MNTREICVSTLEEIEDRSGLSRGELGRLIDDVIREHFAQEALAAGALCGIDLSWVGPISGEKGATASTLAPQ